MVDIGLIPADGNPSAWLFTENSAAIVSGTEVDVAEGCVAAVAAGAVVEVVVAGAVVEDVVAGAVVEVVVTGFAVQIA